MIVLPEKSGGRILTQTPEIVSCAGKMSGLAAAVDLGTTTVAVRLYELAGGREERTLSAWNAQAAYGGDVISRIQYTMDTPDGLQELSRIIRAQVEDMINRALEDCGRKKSELRHTVLAGNTVMQHIFASLPVEGIARAPFKPETLLRMIAATRSSARPCTMRPALQAMSAAISPPGCSHPGYIKIRGAVCFSISARTVRWRSEAVTALHAAP